LAIRPSYQGSALRLPYTALQERVGTVNWRIIISTFALLFLAELGDKTQLAVITMTAKYRAPLPVFLGAALALSLVTLIGVLLGEAITCVIPPALMRKIAAASFVVIGVLIYANVL
jgi:putative Ca2+/H+ antiporter (TMEM165/GDT1 family)